LTLLSDFDYDLPEDRIAQTPLADRAASRLLWLHKDGQLEHRNFAEVPDLLKPGDLLALNDTRVTARRLLGHKPTGGQVELLLLRYLPATREWLALAKPGRRLQPGARILIEGGLEAEILGNEADGLKRLTLSGDPAESGSVPLPPYILAKLSDPERYQTVYAKAPGSAAAPTAGLHFTSDLLERLRARGVETVTITLDVSIDTFRPIQSETLDEHRMHGETCRISAEAAAKINAAPGRIIAVGTTSVRTLESFAIAPRRVRAGEKTTSIFIRPGFSFQVIDGMFTNFHMPRTSMLVMLAALVGRDPLMNAYQSALAEGYRFLSFGDSMLIL
jgi:S-adenosylmethionine:tRNA ribosyltransferase-isomerase